MDTIYFCWNWKYCSKIIFKCVNSIVGPVNSAFCFLHSKFMWCYYSYALGKKKKLKMWTWIQTHTKCLQLFNCLLVCNSLIYKFKILKINYLYFYCLLLLRYWSTHVATTTPTHFNQRLKSAKDKTHNYVNHYKQLKV